MEWVHELFQQYGYYVVLVGLLLEYIALPFPGEPTLTYAGFLSNQGDLSLPILIILSFIGTSIGMTFQYLLGNKLGMPFIQKYGKYVFLTQRKIDVTKMWFDKYGYFLIFIAFYSRRTPLYRVLCRNYQPTISPLCDDNLFRCPILGIILLNWRLLVRENLDVIFIVLSQHIWKIIFGIIIITLITRFRKK